MEPRHYAILLLAALLEVGGLAVIRLGLARRPSGFLLIALGIAILGAYGLFVNTAPVDFSTTLGLYIAFFAVVAVLAGWIVDRGIRLPTVIGIAIIAAGAAIIAHGARQ